MKRPFDAVVWWEIRRIPYNFIMAVAGITTCFVIVAIVSRFFEPGDFFVAPLPGFLGIIAYGIMANLFYTMSWITEIIWTGGDTSRTELMRSQVFRAGLIVSVGITLLPAALVVAVWAIRSFK